MLLVFQKTEFFFSFSWDPPPQPTEDEYAEERPSLSQKSSQHDAVVEEAMHRRKQEWGQEKRSEEERLEKEEMFKVS
jgi:hypothetical protein